MIGGPVLSPGGGRSDGMAAIPDTAALMVDRNRVRPIAQDDRIVERLKARADALMLWTLDEHLADGYGPATNDERPATDHVQDPRQDGADTDQPADPAEGGGGAELMGDQVEPLVRRSDVPGKATGCRLELVGCLPKRAQETAAAQQRYDERREKRVRLEANLAQLREESDTDSRQWQLPVAPAGLLASDGSGGGPVRDCPKIDRAKEDEWQQWIRNGVFGWVHDEWKEAQRTRWVLTRKTAPSSCADSAPRERLKA